MAKYDPWQVAIHMRDALVLAAKPVADNFERDFSEIAPEYKTDDAKTVRTIIDIHAQKIMERQMKRYYEDAVFNLEEDDSQGTGSLDGKLLIFGDPFDGTANLQPQFKLSTQGLMAAEEGRFIAAAALHPFENYVLFGSEDRGVFRAELVVDSDNNYHILHGLDSSQLPNLSDKFRLLKSKKEHVMMAIDAYPNPVNFCAERKALWQTEVIETLDEDHGGPYMCKMIRATGSNIDYCMKLAEGRLHIQNTDFVGGVYDVAVGAVFMPLLGGIMTDMYGNPLRVPKTREEMKTPPQQVIFASINPEMHEAAIKIGHKYYGKDAEIYMPKYKEFVSPGIEYPGAGKWEAKHKAILEELKQR